MLRTGLFLTISVIILSPAAFGDTHIPGGNVSGDWNAAGSPYLIEGHITIPLGETLTIDPGVEVRFTGDYEFFVRGWLFASGTPTDSILFTRPSQYDHWHGIHFIDAPDSSYLEYCIIENSWATADDIGGGGVRLEYSHPVIRHCTFRENLSTMKGGGLYCYYSNPLIADNYFFDNTASSSNGHGGAIALIQSSPLITGNMIIENSAMGYFGSGGGIYMDDSSPLIEWNVISRNYVSATDANGGGLDISGGSPILRHNIIAHNRATGNGYTSSAHGGGAYYSGCWITIENCIIYGNSVSGNSMGAGGLYVGSATDMTNTIVWGNSPNQLSAGSNFTYCDIQGGWTGTGNIDVDPLFIDPSRGDYRLKWGSQCIDVGNPDPLYDDPDGTRADIGVFFYDQSTCVRVLATPQAPPIIIPTAGGQIDFTLTLTNHDQTTHQTTAWTAVTLPDGTTFTPLFGPRSVVLVPGITLDADLIQSVPGNAPGGIYQYNVYAVAEGDTSIDSFEFYKIGTGGMFIAADWITEEEGLENSLASILPTTATLEQNSPNPFNPATEIAFSLSEADFVELTVFDLSGRTLQNLISRQLDAGRHVIPFNGAHLPSGVYLYRLITGDQQLCRKMVLIK